MLFRTMLSVPSNSPRMLLNADLMGADIVLFDLEDGVALDQKPFARELLRTFLAKGLARCNAMVRVNDVNTPFFLDDIADILPLPILGIMLPKMERVEDLHYADEAMRKVEEAHGLEPGSRFIIGTVESALGVENAYACLTGCDRVIGCSFGSEDFAASLGVGRSQSNEELDYGRRRLVVSAKAAGKLAIDTVYTNYSDDEGLRAMTEQGKQLGYDGKFVVSPRQVPVVHAVYTPSEMDIRQALLVRTKMREARQKSLAVAILNGKMLDRPVLQQAERTLAMARAAGISVEEEALYE